MHHQLIQAWKRLVILSGEPLFTVVCLHEVDEFVVWQLQRLILTQIDRFVPFGEGVACSLSLRGDKLFLT